MEYIYGDFTDEQILQAAKAMHNDIHKLLLYKDKNVKEKVFENDDSFLTYFKNIMFKLGGTKTLFNDNKYMVELMSILQSAMDNVTAKDCYNYGTFRKAILDAHGYIKIMFEGGGVYAEPSNS